jgi:hypothetical protein
LFFVRTAGQCFVAFKAAWYIMHLSGNKKGYNDEKALEFLWVLVGLKVACFSSVAMAF